MVSNTLTTLTYPSTLTTKSNTNFGGIMYSSMMNQYDIKGNTFTNIFTFGSGSDAFYINFNSIDDTAIFSLNLDTNVFVHLNTYTLSIANKIDFLLNSKTNTYQYSMIYVQAN